MFRELSRVRTLPPQDRRALPELWLRLLIADLLLRCRPLPAVERRLGRGPAPRAWDPAAWDEAHRLFRLAAAVARHHLYPMACLPRALAVRWALARRGLTARLVIGVAKDGSDLAAHAWLEQGGRVVGGPGQREGYAALEGARGPTSADAARRGG
jgi:hypothetical protein